LGIQRARLQVRAAAKAILGSGGLLRGSWIRRQPFSDEVATTAQERHEVLLAQLRKCEVDGGNHEQQNRCGAHDEARPADSDKQPSQEFVHAG